MSNEGNYEARIVPKSNLQGYVIDSKYIYGGYIVFQNETEKDQFQIDAIENHTQAIKLGTLCYVYGSKNTYRWGRNGWTADTSSGNGGIGSSILKNDLLTYYNIGNIKNASPKNPVIIGQAGENLETILNRIFNKNYPAEQFTTSIRSIDQEFNSDDLKDLKKSEQEKDALQNGKLKGSIWLFNDDIQETLPTTEVKFFSNNEYFDRITHRWDPNVLISFERLFYHKFGIEEGSGSWLEVSVDVHLYKDDWWNNVNYKQIILDQDTVDDNFLSWLKLNATLLKYTAATFVELRQKEYRSNGTENNLPIYVEAAKRDDIGRDIRATYATKSDMAEYVRDAEADLNVQIKANKDRLNILSGSLNELNNQYAQKDDLEALQFRVELLEGNTSTSGIDLSNIDTDTIITIISGYDGRILSLENISGILVDEVEDVKDTVGENTNKIRDLQDQIDLLAITPEDIADLTEKANKASADVAILDNKINTNTASLSGLIGDNSAAINVLRRDLTSESNARDSADTSINGRITNLNAAVFGEDGLSSKVDKNTRDINSNQVNIGKNADAIEELKDRLNNLPDLDKLQTAEEIIDTFNENSEAINDLIGNFRDEIEDIRGYESRISANEEQIRDNTADIQDLLTRVGTAESTIISHTNTLENHEGRIGNNKRLIDQLQADIENLGLSRDQIDAIGDYSQTIVDLKKSIKQNSDNIVTVNTNITNRINGLVPTIQQNYEDIQALKLSTASWDTSIKNNRERIIRIEEQFAELDLTRADIDRIENSIENLRDDVRSAEDTIESHRTSIESNTAEIAKLNNQLSKTKVQAATNEAKIRTLEPIVRKNEVDILALSNTIKNEYQKKLVPGSYVSINNLTNKIDVDLSSRQEVLTPGNNVKIEKDDETGETTISVDLSAYAAAANVQSELDKKLEITDNVDTDKEILKPTSSSDQLYTQILTNNNENVKVIVIDTPEEMVPNNFTLYFIKSTNEWRFVQ